jgi:hypothetical protein
MNDQNTQPLFLLIEQVYCSDYNTYVDEVVGYSFDKEHLQKIANVKIKHQATLKLYLENFHKVTLPAWEKENPEPQIESYTLIKEPKFIFPIGQPQVITNEMRAEKASIINQNKQIVQKANHNHDQWFALRQAFISEHCKGADNLDSLWKVEQVNKITGTI